MARVPVLVLLIATTLSQTLHAQTIITSENPKAVSVTVYRDPARSNGGEINLSALNGFALISEKRIISVPQGEAVIRFEGVAGGIIPVSAVVTGLPGGVIQKNRDAQLLSPAALINGSLGRRVNLKRTNKQTGKITESTADIIAGPEGGVLLKTATGIEALGCDGLPESLNYNKVPDGLTARPTLSVTTRSERATTATVELSYLASGFDWAANYIVDINADGKTLNLFSWLTLANSNAESFSRANTQAVAGTLNRTDAPDVANTAPQPTLSLQCWPRDITSTHPKWGLETLDLQRRRLFEKNSSDSIVVTAMRLTAPMMESAAPVMVMMAKQEELGDLKLYRIPEPVTVAANAQKQVAFLTKNNVPFEQLYKIELNANYVQSAPQPLQKILRLKNTLEKKLGVPLPSGTVAVFAHAENETLLIGQDLVRDSAIGETAELKIGMSAQVQATLTNNPSPDKKIITLTNANAKPVQVEVHIITSATQKLLSPSQKLGRKNGQALWATTVPANGTVSLTYAWQAK
jgi:hypothetical protein